MALMNGETGYTLVMSDLPSAENNVMTDQTVEAIEERFKVAKQQNQVLQIVDFLGCPLRLDALVYLPSLFRKYVNYKRIETIALSKSISCLEFAEGSAVVSQVSAMFHEAINVKKFSLSQTACPFAFRDVAGMLTKFKHLNCLELVDLGLGEDNFQQLASCLHESGRLEHLRVLRLDQNKPDDKGSVVVGKDILCSAVSLEVFTYRGCSPSAVGTAFLLKGLSEACDRAKEDGRDHPMKVLDLYGCELCASDRLYEESELASKNGFAFLFDALPVMKKLQKLDLGDCCSEISFEILEEFQNALAGKTLSKLGLAYWELPQDGIWELSLDIVSRHQDSLVELDLSDTELGDGRATQLFELFEGKGIKELNLENTDLSGNFADVLEAAHLPEMAHLILNSNTDLIDALENGEEGAVTLAALREKWGTVEVEEF